MKEERYFVAKETPWYVKLVKRIFLLYIYLRFPRVPKTYKYCIRENYFSRLYQWKFFLKDYITKPEYKSIVYQGEFQQELLFALPFAYWHHCNGTLKETVSSQFTNELYFFSKSHDQRFTKRNWLGIFDYRFPNTSHNFSFDYSKWKRVPLKEKFQNDVFIFDKPILVIANRFNVEWDSGPISFLDISVLDQVIEMLTDDFQIVYNRPQSTDITDDNSEVKELGELDWLRIHHPDVIIMQDLFKKRGSSVKNYNHLQLMVYANCSHFISTHGGTGALASYFGGTNILYSKQGHEHYLKEFETIFPKLSGARVCHVKSHGELLLKVRELYLNTADRRIEAGRV